MLIIPLDIPTTTTITTTTTTTSSSSGSGSGCNIQWYDQQSTTTVAMAQSLLPPPPSGSAKMTFGYIMSNITAHQHYAKVFKGIRVSLLITYVYDTVLVPYFGYGSLHNKRSNINSSCRL